MGQLQGLKNYIYNIKPVMLKLRTKKRLTTEERETIVQFYLEVADYLSRK